MDELQRTDPEAYLEKLQQVDKDRMEVLENNCYYFIHKLRYTSYLLQFNKLTENAQILKTKRF